MVHLSSVQVNAEKAERLRFRAAQRFRFAQLQCKALSAPLPDEPAATDHNLMDQQLLNLHLDSQRNTHRAGSPRLGSSASDLLLWLAAEAERCPVPGGWRRVDEELYIDEFSCLPPRTVHPMLGYFLRLAAVVLALPEKSCQRVMMDISNLHKDLLAECAGLHQQYENPQACGLKEWYHKQRGWFTRSDPLQAHAYLQRVVKDLESKLRLSLEGGQEESDEASCQGQAKASKDPEAGTDAGSCCFFDISQPRRTKSLISSPENTLGSSIGRTELECQYEQNWSSLVSSRLLSTQDTPQTLHSSSESEGGIRSIGLNSSNSLAALAAISKETLRELRPSDLWAQLDPSTLSSPSSAKDPENTHCQEVHHAQSRQSVTDPGGCWSNR
ncbi:unnamed protein product [Durusdinium trenchii]|uniref:Uncharacterized protein n=1 Tax=Durusdinium trenchii TaxID=1381693 RepID=A0ABP0JU55_9DINO